MIFLSSCGNSQQAQNQASLTQTGTLSDSQVEVHIQAPESPEQAVKIFYQYLNAGKYAEAYALWDDNGKASGYSYPDFKKGYSSLAASHYTITGDITLKSNLGIHSASIPVKVSLTSKNGKTLVYTGTYTTLQADTGT